MNHIAVDVFDLKLGHGGTKSSLRVRKAIHPELSNHEEIRPSHAVATFGCIALLKNETLNRLTDKFFILIDCSAVKQSIANSLNSIIEDLGMPLCIEQLVRAEAYRWHLLSVIQPDSS